MQKVTIDFESYYDSQFNIKKLGTAEYVRDPRFFIHGCAVKIEDAPGVWYTRQQFEDAIPLLNKSLVISHNGLFDFLVLAEKFNCRPAKLMCTLSLARAVLPRGTPLDLGALAKLLTLGKKGTELESSKGLKELPPLIAIALAGYSINDADLAWGIYKALIPFISDEQADFIDLIMRMSTQGKLLFDNAVGDEVLDLIQNERTKLVEACGVTDVSQLTSRDKFAALLKDRGVEPPRKISLANGKETYAFSKQDPEFVKLQVNPAVADIVKARMAHTSNNAFKRVQRLQRIAKHPPYTIPAQLNPYGAHTTRLSGGGKLNLQNLNARGPQAKLRKAFHAPPGYVIIVFDLSGIELRLNLWFSGEEDKLNIIRQGGDIYVVQASELLGKEAELVEHLERQFGKVVVLACGYGMGGARFRITCAIGPMGIEPIYISETEAVNTVTQYRISNPFVVGSWNFLGSTGLQAMYSSTELKHKCITFKHEAIELPSGLELMYPGLTPTEDGWISSYNGRTKRLYGGILQENIVQALAATLINESMLRIDKLDMPGDLVLQVHDELLYLAPENEAEDIAVEMKASMIQVPSWCPGLPLDAKGGYSFCYDK